VISEALLHRHARERTTEPPFFLSAGSTLLRTSTAPTTCKEKQLRKSTGEARLSGLRTMSPAQYAKPLQSSGTWPLRLDAIVSEAITSRTEKGAPPHSADSASSLLESRPMSHGRVPAAKTRRASARPIAPVAPTIAIVISKDGCPTWMLPEVSWQFPKLRLAARPK
jgi:hypothetical protein